MKYRKQPGYLVVMCAVLAACGAKGPPAKNPDGSPKLDAAQTLKIKRRLAEIAGQANGAAPAVIDPDTRLDGAKAGPGLKLTSTYTLVNAASNGVNSATFDTKLTPVIKQGSCTNPDLRPLIDQGVVVVLEYRGNDGKPIGTVSVNRATCLALK